MASLSESSVSARRVVRYSLYGFIVILILRFLLLTGVDLYHKYFPEKPKATLAFGKLPVLPFPQKEVPEGLTYSLELPQGSLPAMGDLVQVYFMPPFQRNINALEEAKQKAQAFSFLPEEKQVAETIPNVYVFQHRKEPTNFTMNIVTGIFSIGYNFDANPQVLNGVPPSSEGATQKVLTILGTATIYPNDFDKGPIHTTYFKVEGGRFVEVSSLSEATLTRLDLFRKNYGKKEDIPAVSPNHPNSNVWFMYAGGSNIPVVGEYHYFPVDAEKSASYPLKSSEVAWQDLQAGKGFVANAGNPQEKNVVIRKVYLAYYDAGQYAPFYQPVIVFEGDNGFAAFVPAVPDDYYGAEVKN